MTETRTSMNPYESFVKSEFNRLSDDSLRSISGSVVPYVIEQKGQMERVYDIYSRLLMERIIFLGTPINYEISNVVIAQLLFLAATDPEKDIIMYINSPGGSVTDGLAIYDTMEFIKPEIQTTCTGMAASMGAILLMAGTKGKRYALPHSRIMLHQPLGETQGQSSDIEIYMQEIVKMKDQLNKIIMQRTGQNAERLEKDIDRNFFMSSDEAKAYGIIDEVLVRKK